jgi:protein MpaA
VNKALLIGPLAALFALGGGAPAARPQGALSPVTHGARSLLGRSEDGRPIALVRAGDPAGARVLVFGLIHGNEDAGIPVTRALERLGAGSPANLWIVPDLNPDGHARDTRQDARGVDLNRNWSSGWRRGGRPFDTYYGGPRPFSERETRLARALILRVRPRVTIWFHQHMNLIWANGSPGLRAGRIYARASGMRLYHHASLPGTSTLWQDRQLRGNAALTVELPAGSLSARQVRAHVRAVLAVAREL